MHRRVIALFFCFGISLAACLPTARSKPPRRPARLVGKVPLIPGKSELLLVATTINKMPATFLFDTGCPSTIISDTLAAKLQVRPWKEFAGRTTNFNGYPGAWLTRLDLQQWGDVTVKGLPAFVGNDKLFKIDPGHEADNDGFFGMVEMRALKMAVAVYPQAASMTFYLPGNLRSAERNAAGFGPHALEVPLVWEESGTPGCAGRRWRRARECGRVGWSWTRAATRPASRRWPPRSWILPSLRRAGLSVSGV